MFGSQISVFLKITNEWNTSCYQCLASRHIKLSYAFSTKKKPGRNPDSHIAVRLHQTIELQLTQNVLLAQILTRYQSRWPRASPKIHHSSARPGSNVHFSSSYLAAQPRDFAAACWVLCVCVGVVAPGVYHLSTQLKRRLNSARILHCIKSFCFAYAAHAGRLAQTVVGVTIFFSVRRWLVRLCVRPQIHARAVVMCRICFAWIWCI